MLRDTIWYYLGSICTSVAQRARLVYNNVRTWGTVHRLVPLKLDFYEIRQIIGLCFWHPPSYVTDRLSIIDINNRPLERLGLAVRCRTSFVSVVVDGDGSVNELKVSVRILENLRTQSFLLHQRIPWTKWRRACRNVLNQFYPTPWSLSEHIDSQVRLWDIVDPDKMPHLSLVVRCSLHLEHQSNT